MSERDDNGGSPPPRSVGVVGLGLIGGSLARALRRRFPEIRLVGVTATPGTAAAALAEGVCDAAGPDPTALAGVEVAVLCTPVDVMPRWLAACAALSGTLLVTDAGSTKAWVTERAVPLLGDRFLGGHPMAGRERSGWEAADPELFDGAPWVLTPHAPGQLERFASWRAAVRGIGALEVVLDAADHDAATALVSHLPFTLSAALVRAATGRPEWAAGRLLAATGFRDMARLAGGDPAMEAAILRTNAVPLLEALDALERELRAVRELVAATAALDAWFAEARELRASWLDERRRLGRPVP